MKTTRLLLGAAALAALAFAGASAPAKAAGLFSFPQATVNTQTGNETIPMDSNLGSGINPATEIFSTQQLNLLGYVFVNAATANGASSGSQRASVSPGIGTMVVSAAQPLLAFGVSLPTGPVDGQTFALASNMSFATLTVSANTGTTINNNPTSLAVGGPPSAFGFKFIFHAADTTWYRLQ